MLATEFNLTSICNPWLFAPPLLLLGCAVVLAGRKAWAAATFSIAAHAVVLALFGISISSAVSGDAVSSNSPVEISVIPLPEFSLDSATASEEVAADAPASVDLLAAANVEPADLSLTGIEVKVREQVAAADEHAGSASVAEIDSEFNRRRLEGNGQEGILCISCIWKNFSDMDLHVIDPRGNHIYWRADQPLRAKLDIDRNIGEPNLTEAPIENIRWLATDHPPPGKYVIKVDNFTHRSKEPVECLVRVSVNGRQVALHYLSVSHNSATSVEAPEGRVPDFDYAP